MPTIEDIQELADKYLDEALANGEPFSEALCNWAIDKAKEELS